MLCVRRMARLLPAAVRPVTADRSLCRHATRYVRVRTFARRYTMAASVVEVPHHHHPTPPALDQLRAQVHELSSSNALHDDMQRTISLVESCVSPRYVYMCVRKVCQRMG